MATCCREQLGFTDPSAGNYNCTDCGGPVNETVTTPERYVEWNREHMGIKDTTEIIDAIKEMIIQRDSN